MHHGRELGNDNDQVHPSVSVATISYHQAKSLTYSAPLSQIWLQRVGLVVCFLLAATSVSDQHLFPTQI